MASVHRERGFDFQIYLNDHGEPHVHVWKAGKTVEIRIGDSKTPARVEVEGGMKSNDVTRAVRIVDEHWEKLLRAWRQIHG